MTIEIIDRATGEVVKSIFVKTKREADRTVKALLEQVNLEDYYIKEAV